MATFTEHKQHEDENKTKPSRVQKLKMWLKMRWNNVSDTGKYNSLIILLVMVVLLWFFANYIDAITASMEELGS